MIYEYLQLLTTSASNYARELGYLKESIAFEARAQRNWKLWEAHFQECHNLILEQCSSLNEGQSSIWVLGSGSLFETPWKNLLEQGFQIKLVDVFHPLRVRKLAKENPGLDLLEMDITGFDQLSPVQKILLKSPKPPPLSLNPQDFIISSNIWSQLPIMPMKFLIDNTEINTSEKLQWAKTIQVHHEEWLANLGCRGLIFSDFEIHNLNGKSQVISIEQQPHRPQHFSLLKSWNWRFSTKTIRKVEAYSISAKTL